MPGEDELDLPEVGDGEGNEGARQGQEGDGPADQESGDEQEADADEGQDGSDEVDGEPRRARSRRDARIENLLEARKADKERADRLERDLNELRGSRQQAQQRQESPEEEAARLSLMTPEERSEYRVNKALRTSQEQTQRMIFQMQETSDKSAFDAKATVDPLYARFAPEVEIELTKLRGQGQNVPREVLFELAVGRAALANRNKAKGLKGKGKQAVERQRGTPLNGKADQQAQRRKSGDSPAKRLDGVSI